MIYVAIIYISGAVFFLMQAHLYAKVNRERIIGAVTWPILIFALPVIIGAYLEGCREGGCGLMSIKIGDRWGIGA